MDGTLTARIAVTDDLFKFRQRYLPIKAYKLIPDRFRHMIGT